MFFVGFCCVKRQGGEKVEKNGKGGLDRIKQRQFWW